AQTPWPRRKYEGEWVIATAVAAFGGYDLTGGFRFVHLGNESCVVCRNDNGRKRYEAWVLGSTTGRKIAGPLKHQKPVDYAAFSVDGTHVVTASEDETAVVWDARTGQRIAGPLAHQEVVMHAAFSVDGTRVV